MGHFEHFETSEYFNTLSSQILFVLKQGYEKRGKKNFVFKSKNISKDLGYPNKIIGRTLAELSKSGDCVKKDLDTNIVLWKTDF